jgi:hypothetical protein
VHESLESNLHGGRIAEGRFWAGVEVGSFEESVEGLAHQRRKGGSNAFKVCCHGDFWTC